MALHPLAGQPARPEDLANIPRLVSTYYTRHPEPASPLEPVAFGTSGHRGSSLKGSFNEAHILAITRAICEYRGAAGIDGRSSVFFISQRWVTVFTPTPT